MSEGDSIHFLSRRLRPALVGRIPERVLAPHPRARALRWPEKLAGRAITSVDARGKHLLVRFEGGLVVHSHLGMTGSWRVYEGGEMWRRSPRSAWLWMSVDDREVVQFSGPTLELFAERRLAFHPRLARLGPDICAPEFEPRAAIARLRADDPSRGVGDALLDQRNVAGIGNLWKVEACWLARLDPWRALGETSDDELAGVLAEARPRMRDSAVNGRQWRFKVLYGTAGRPCPRCGERVQVRRQGEAARPTWSCPGCQR